MTTINDLAKEFDVEPHIMFAFAGVLTYGPDGYNAELDESLVKMIRDCFMTDIED